MDWVKTIIASLQLIETEIYETRLNADYLAEKLFISTSHYQRAFSILTGLAVNEYIRNRRLTLAAMTLVREDHSVLDTALTFGYETPESFAKAFKRFHGITPSEAKKKEIQLKAFPPLQLQIILKGEEAMNYSIVEKPAFELIGKSIVVSTENAENQTEIPKFWDRCHQEGLVEKLCALEGFEGLVGACIMEDRPEVSKEFTYAIAAMTNHSDPGTQLENWHIPAFTWAVFESIGPMPGAIQEVFRRIFSEWFPATGFEHAAGPELEVYPAGNPSAPDYRCEVWIPIVKK